MTRFDPINGRFRARQAECDKDIAAAQALRALAFHGTDVPVGLDHDQFDPLCTHYLVEDRDSGTLVCCYRVLPLANGADIAGSYSAQFYDLSGLSAFPDPMVELGRFCIHPDWQDPDILRVAWGALTRYVDDKKVEIMFGCSSFPGTDEAGYLDAFALLKDRHLAPEHMSPRVKAPQIFPYADKLRIYPPDAKAGMQVMPPLLRTYLLMGGWVSDHAVVDHHMNTLHVFTGLEIRAIPDTRKRLLRAVAQ